MESIESRIKAIAKERIEAAGKVTTKGTDYTFEKPINRMQQYMVAMLKEHHIYGNWSSTGAGKTNSALVAGRVLGCRVMLIICPNSVKNDWVAAIMGEKNKDGEKVKKGAYEKNSRDEFFRLLNMTLKIVLMVSAPAAVYFMIYAGETISILAGAGFSGAVLPMVIIMPSVIFIGISNIIGIQMLVPSNREKTVVKAAVLGAITDLILNLILIPGYGPAGAAAATLAAEVIVMFYMIFEVRDSAAELFRDMPAGIMVTALIISTVAGLALKRLIDGPFLTLAVSAVCFYGLYALIIYCYELLHRN